MNIAKKIVLLLSIVVISSNFIFADNTITTRNMVNEIYYISEQVISESNNRTFLDDAYSHLFNNLNLRLIDDETRTQVTRLMTAIEQYRMIDIKRERLDIVYDYQKSSTIASAVPNPINMIGSLAMITVSPVSAIAGIVGTAASSMAMYSATMEQVDLDMLEMKWELDDSARANMVSINTDLFDYISSFSNKTQTDTNFFLNQELVSSFVEMVNDNDIDRAIQSLEDMEDDLFFFPTYWLELADKYYKDGRYEECLRTIDYYEENFDYKELYRKNYRYAQILVDGISSIINLGNIEKAEIDQIILWLEIIEQNTRLDDWLQRYFCASVYLSLVNFGVDNQYLFDKAISLIRENLTQLSKEQEQLNRDYFNPVKNLSEVSSATDSEAKSNEVKVYLSELEDERKTELPTMNSAYATNLRLMYTILESSGYGTEKFLIEYGYLKNSIPVPQLRSALFNEDLTIQDGIVEINKKGFGNRKFEVTVPANFINTETEFDIKLTPAYDGKTNDYGKLMFFTGVYKMEDSSNCVGSIKVKKVNRPKNYTSTNQFIATLEIELNEDFIEARENFGINLRINTCDCPIVIEFRGKKPSSLGVDEMKKDWSLPSFFNSFEGLR